MNKEDLTVGGLLMTNTGSAFLANFFCFGLFYLTKVLELTVYLQTALKNTAILRHYFRAK